MSDVSGQKILGKSESIDASTIYNIKGQTPSGLEGLVKTREINYIWDKNS